MPDFAAPVERLIDELKHLPGIGQKTAQRLAFYLLRIPVEDALGLADAIGDLRSTLRARYGDKVLTPVIAPASGMLSGPVPPITG